MLQARSVYIGNQSLLLHVAGSFKKWFQRFIAGILAVTFFGVCAARDITKNTGDAFIQRNMNCPNHLCWFPYHAASIPWWALWAFVCFHVFL